MNVSIYLSDAEIEEFKAVSHEGESVAQAVKRLAKERMVNQEDKQPITTGEHLNRLVAETKWIIGKYKEGKIQE